MISVVRRLTIISLVSLALTACSAIPITSLPRLAGMSPQTMDFSKLELAVRVQDDFNVIEESAKFQITIVNEGDGELLDEELILEDDDRGLTPGLKKKLKPGFHIIRYRVGEETAERANKIRSEVIALKEANPDGNRGSFSASANICRMPDGNPLLTPQMTLLVRFDPEDEFFTLIKETKLPISEFPKTEKGICKTKE